MIVDPKQKLKDLYFYNNLLLIISIFCIVCFITALELEGRTQYNKKFYKIEDGQLFGPIIVTKNRPKIYEIKANFFGDNQSVYISGEVLDEDKDTLYEFGKDLWHESGYDSEGYWSESDPQMTAKLAFTEPGKYYIKLSTDENVMPTLSFSVSRKIASGIPHFILGCYLLLFLYVAFICLNLKWIKEKLIVINDILEEMDD